MDDIEEVSIPFKREGLSEHIRKHGNVPCLCASFNSLQTGRSFRTQAQPDQNPDVDKSFNSLQTGRSFRTIRIEASHTLDPRFNSLQTGRSFRTSQLKKSTRLPLSCFNSLQTGRSFRTTYTLRCYKIVTCIVSIPFKREGLSEQSFYSHSSSFTVTGFQFPSNGKVFPNGIQLVKKSNEPATMFQFPSNGKVFPNATAPATAPASPLLFQFPSNGKVFPNPSNQFRI